MKALSFALTAFITVISAQGADAKPYKVAERPGASGYFNVQDQGDVWIVGYTGEPGQSAHEVAEYALKRGADLAAEQHQEWFAVLKTINRLVEAGVPDDLEIRAGNFMGSGAGGTTSAPVAGGPPPNSQGNTGTFGGEAVPDNVLERWQPRRVRQTILVIKLGSGDKGSFPELDHPPQILPATAPSASPAK